MEQVGRSYLLPQLLVCVLDHPQLSVRHPETDQIKYNYPLAVNNLPTPFVVNLATFAVVLRIDNACIGNVCGYVNKLQ